MGALECIERIAATSLIDADLQYCLVDANKLPFQINGKPARTNDASTFVTLDELLSCASLDKYEAVGISVQASKLCAVDIDHCLTVPNDFSTMSDLARDVVEMFKDFAYVEASFSGLGIRILTRQNCVPNYKSQFYLKNSKIHLEYYQYDQLGRYVTLTGNCLYDNPIDDFKHDKVILDFLNAYMKRPVVQHVAHARVTESRPFDELMRRVRSLYRRDFSFQSLWFDKAPGHGSNESERDYQLIAELYDNVTKDPEMIIKIFKESPFYKSKDREHVYKFNRNENRYFWYYFEWISGSRL